MNLRVNYKINKLPGIYMRDRHHPRQKTDFFFAIMIPEACGTGWPKA